MAKQTVRYMKGAAIGYRAVASQEAAINKLGRIEARGEDLLNHVCDYACRHPGEADMDEMDGICKECPVTKLLKIIE